MKILGTKYCGHDSAVCLIDTSKKTIFAISTERITRIKHDQIDITPIEDRDIRLLKKQSIVYDIIYNPEKTLFISIDNPFYNFI